MTTNAISACMGGMLSTQPSNVQDVTGPIKWYHGSRLSPPITNQKKDVTKKYIYDGSEIHLNFGGAVPKYTPVGAGEQCPCGSGKPYLDCCLDRGFKYVRDDKGKVLKYQPEFELRNKPKDPTEKDDDDEPEVENLSPMLVVEICEHGSFNIHCMIELNMNRIQMCDLKAILSFIERQKAVTTIAIVRGGPRQNKEDVIPIVLTGEDEDGEMIMVGGARPEDLQGFPEKDLLELIDHLEHLRMNIMALVMQKCVAHFMFPHDGVDDNDEDDDE